MSELSVAERYVLDSVGCIVRRGVIDLAEILRAKHAINTQVSPITWKFPTLFLDDIFWHWMERHELFLPAREACGPHVRMDHAFGLRGGGVSSSPRNLHGGPNCNIGSCFYHDARGALGITGQLVVGVSLVGQTPETGGFCYLPGSHKSFLPANGNELTSHLLGNGFDHESIVVPTLKPGDVVMFFEALVHGDTGVRKPSERMAAYYKYVPGFACWRDPAQQERYRDFAIQNNKSQRIKQLLMPPWSAQYDDTNDTSCSISNVKRPPTP